MAEVLEISAQVPETTVASFLKALDGYRTQLGNTQKVAVRRGTIALIRSLRARTPKAKKQVAASAVKQYGGNGPHWITPKGKHQKSQRRFTITRRGGADTRVYTCPADSRADARKRHGQLTRWGLAKKSWGWFMQTLFNRSNPDAANPKAKVDGRMVETSGIREIVTGHNPRVEVTITNKLDYMRSILPDGALAEAMRLATNSINKQIQSGLAAARKELP